MVPAVVIRDFVFPFKDNFPLDRGMLSNCLFWGVSALRAQSASQGQSSTSIHLRPIGLNEILFISLFSAEFLRGENDHI